MTPATEALLAFDVDEVLADAKRAAARRTPEERARHIAALGRARIEAARYLLAHGNPSDRRLAARFAFGMTGRAA
ncbi:MAG TPA: hypothetical protein PLP50_16815 [Thermoanaerobaculia bacterium]|nr:hypothetical protein [Thermoanaerobaculia bacterium]HQN09840.1 hypothetical protein [Thermoanaerobaculia bacterium]HQP88647.1 hypothetical protein [Thermoanaerobaculia bacterium]